MAASRANAPIRPGAGQAQVRGGAAEALARGSSRDADLGTDEYFASHRHGPFTPSIERAPLDDEIDVAVIGA